MKLGDKEKKEEKSVEDRKEKIVKENEAKNEETVQ